MRSASSRARPLITRTTLRTSCALVLIAALPALFADDKWTPELQMRVQNVGDVVPSPSGKLVVWTQTRAIIETERSESATDLWMAHADGSGRKRLAYGRAPQFSSDEKFLYFTRGRTIMRLALEGGEAQTVLDWKGSLATFRLSPDGKSLGFSGREPDADREKARREKRDFRVVGENPPNHLIYVMPLDGSGKWRAITNGAWHAGSFNWSPDSTQIVSEARPTPDADDGPRSDVFEVDVAAGTAKPIATSRATESQPAYSPDSRYIAFVRSEDPPLQPGDDHIILYNRGTSAMRQLPDTNDRLPRLIGWTGDSRGLYYVEGRGTRNAIYMMPVDGAPKLAFAPPGVMASEHVSADGTHFGYVFETSSKPPEAFTRSGMASEQVQVSAANTDLALPPLGKTEVYWWRSNDNTEIEGLVTYPVGYQQGTKAPLVVVIHGGPYGAFTETFIGRHGLYPIATFAANGYAVLQPNPRASTGYGRDFRYANLKDWGGHDYEDIMSGVDMMIRDGIVDPNRMAVMGWSYGGFMTAWTITHTKRFKCAAIGAGVVDWVSQTGTSDIRSNKVDAFGAPWDQMKFYIDRSPITHVSAVATPTLILHGEADERVPTSQGYELFYALKRLGVETKMVVYPRTPHGPQEPKFVLDIMQRHVDWVATHLK